MTELATRYVAQTASLYGFFYLDRICFLCANDYASSNRPLNLL